MTTSGRLLQGSIARVSTVLGVAALIMALLPAGAFGAPRPQVSQQQQGDELGACPVTAPDQSFADRNTIPEAHIDNVDCAAFFDIVLGFADDEFRPSISVRRDQMASFIGRTLEAADVELPAASAGQDFDDVSAANPHRENIRRLEAAGIVQGGPLGMADDSYGPGLPTRRDQMTSLIIRAAEFAFDQEFSNATQQFNDVPSGNVHFANINFAAQNGIVQGFNAETFGPGLFTRRDQMASFAVRLLNFLRTPADVEITQQSAESATVGQSITVTASAFTQYRDEAQEAGGDAGVGAGTEVTFETSVTTNPNSQTVTTGADGEAEFTFTAATPGSVTVTASIAGPGGNFAHADGDSHSVEKEFVRGTNQEFVVTPSAAETNPEDGSRQYTADVGDAAEVELALAEAAHVTVEDGVVSFSSSDGTADFGTTAAYLSHVDDVTQSTGTQQVTVDPGDDGEFTFTVQGEGNTVESVVPVVFVGNDDDELPVNDAGEPENDFGIGGEKTFADVHTLVLTPESTTNRYGTDHSVDATLATGPNLDDGDQAVALEGETLEFRVAETTQGTAAPNDAFTADDCPDPGAVTVDQVVADGTAETDASGTATFSYTGPDDPDTGADGDRTFHCVYADWQGEADSDYEGQSAQGQAFKVWSDAQPVADTVTLTPESSTNLVGTDHAMEATVTDQFGDPFPDARVKFEVYEDTAPQEGSGDNTRTPIVEDVAITNTDGLASFTYAGPSASRDDVIVACLSDGDCFTYDSGADETTAAQPADDAVKFWVEQAEDGIFEGEVIGFDRDGNFVDISSLTTDTNRRLEYSSADTFTVTCAGGGTPASDLDSFESALSFGDTLAATYDADGASTFSLVDQDNSHSACTPAA